MPRIRNRAFKKTAPSDLRISSEPDEETPDSDDSTALRPKVKQESREKQIIHNKAKKRTAPFKKTRKRPNPPSPESSSDSDDSSDGQSNVNNQITSKPTYHNKARKSISPPKPSTSRDPPANHNRSLRSANKKTSINYNASTSKNRKSKNKRNCESDSDEESSATSNNELEMSTLTNVKKKSGTLPILKDQKKSIHKLDITNLVNKFVYYLLIADQKKYPIKKQDILKHVFAPTANTKLYNNILRLVNDKLQQVYGLELMELEDQKKNYMLINKIPEMLKYAEYSEVTQGKRGLILFLLTIIYMNGNVISEVDLWAALKTFGIDSDSRTPHPLFGDVRKYITIELVRQMYLKYDRHPSKDPKNNEFRWGLRAKQEVDKRDLLEFNCEVTDTEPKDWLLQYKDSERAAESGC